MASRKKDSSAGRRQQQADRAVRPAMRSPGHPPAGRDLERAFWREIAQGFSTDDATARVGVSAPVGRRWFRQSGGMSPINTAEPSDRYLSFDEREEIALLRAKQHGVREIARQVGRDAGTVSRELRRNAATRAGERDYRASVAQWKAEKAGPPSISEAGDCQYVLSESALANNDGGA